MPRQYKATASKAPRRFAIYLRCSSDDQKHGDYTTIDTQRELNRRCVEGAGGHVVAEYADEGKTGTNLKRPDWKRLLADAQAKQFDAVCVTYMSRLARGEVYHVAEYLLAEADVQIVLVQEHFTPDLAGHVNKQFTILMDGMYPKMVSQWTRTKMEAMVAKGYWCGQHPFGYAKELVTDAGGFHSAEKEPPKRVVPHPDQAPIVARAFALCRQHGTLAAARDYLNSVTDENWTTTRVKWLLQNETYLGIQQFGRWRNEAAHAPLVERVVWDEVQAIVAALGERTRPRAARNGGTDDPKDNPNLHFYLRGHVFCPHCQSPYTQAAFHGRGARVPYYVCQTENRRSVTKKTGADMCPVRRVNADALHLLILSEIERAARHPTWMHEILAGSGDVGKPDAGLVAERGQLGKRLQALEMRAANYVKAIGDGRGSDAVFDALAKIEGEIREVKARVGDAALRVAQASAKRPTAAQVQAAWGQVLDLWPHMTGEERTRVLGGLVERVEIVSKNEIHLELRPFPDMVLGGSQCAQGSDEIFALSAEMGAERSLNANSPAPSLVVFPVIRGNTPLLTVA